MSVQLILSHKKIILDPYHHATINIKAIFAAMPSNLFALFKVKTNSKDLVDVKPSSGMLSNQNEQDTTASLSIKYLGRLDKLKKMKLQINWVWGQGVPQKKLSHKEFSQLYSSLKSKMGSQKSYTLQFISQQVQLKNLDEQKELLEELSQCQTIFQGNKEIDQNTGLIKMKKIISGNKRNRKRLNWILIILCALVIFFIGVFVGIQIQKSDSQKGQKQIIENNAQTVPQQRLSSQTKSQYELKDQKSSQKQEKSNQKIKAHEKQIGESRQSQGETVP